jgi:vacuolar-type H+-ATPase subunit D/Vma8
MYQSNASVEISTHDFAAFAKLSKFNPIRRFIEAIDFSKLPLLDNTVTKIALSLTEQSQNTIMMVNGS